jgi:AraC-like DNA-binding protein
VKAIPATDEGTLRIWRPSHLQSLELRLGTAFRHPYPAHWHEELLVSAITGGAGYLHHRGSSHRTTAGMLFVIAPGEVHANYPCDEGCSFRSIYAPPSVVRNGVTDLTEQVGAFPDVPSGMVGAARILRSFLRLHDALERATTPLYRDSLLLDFLAHLIGYNREGSRQQRTLCNESTAVRRAQEFLHEYYAERISLGDLARHVGLSPSYFHRSFCRQTGMPPHAYQTQVRIARAKSLLSRNWPIAKVASETGFADQSHFTRCFKRFVGVPPGQYSD